MVQEHNDEINLLQLLQTLWNKKYTILFITFISFLFGIYFAKGLPSRFQVTTPIEYGNESLFIKYLIISDVLNRNETKTFVKNKPGPFSLGPENIFNKFISEFNDYNEMIITLRKSKFVNELIKDKNKSEQKTILISLAKSFQVLKNKNNEWNLSFTWHDVKEGKYLFNKAILLTLENIKRNILTDLKALTELLNAKNKRDIISLNDQVELIEGSLKLQIKKRIKFLNEQSTIAKEIGLENNLDYRSNSVSSNFTNLTIEALRDPLMFGDDYFSAYDNNFNNLPYYLRGYKPIEKEIEIIKSRSNEEILLMSSGYVNLQSKLSLLKKNRISNQLNYWALEISNDNSNKWLRFDFDFASTKSLNNSMMYLFVSIIFGFILGSIFVLIYSSISKSKDIFK